MEKHTSSNTLPRKCSSKNTDTRPSSARRFFPRCAGSRALPDAMSVMKTDSEIFCRQPSYTPDLRTDRIAEAVDVAIVHQKVVTAPAGHRSNCRRMALYLDTVAPGFRIAHGPQFAIVTGGIKSVARGGRCDSSDVASRTGLEPGSVL